VKGTLIALLLSATFAAFSMPIAVERGVVVQGGLHFTKTIVLDQTMKTEGGGILTKGSYEVRFESLPGNKVHAIFLQGGTQKGEANGIIIVGGSNQAAGMVRGPGPAPVGKNAFSFEDLGLHPISAHAFQTQGQKLNLVVNGQGTNQILIGLLLPAVQKGIIGPIDMHGQKVQPGN
jgi:hypothetical protein